jgi:hypothetical protein
VPYFTIECFIIGPILEYDIIKFSTRSGFSLALLIVEVDFDEFRFGHVRYAHSDTNGLQTTFDTSDALLVMRYRGL